MQDLVAFFCVAVAADAAFWVAGGRGKALYSLVTGFTWAEVVCPHPNVLHTLPSQRAYGWVF